MDSRMRTVYHHRLNKEFGSKFSEANRLQQKAPEEGRRIEWLKHCKYNNQDEDNTLNHVNNINYIMLSIYSLYIWFYIYMRKIVLKIR